MSQQLIEFWLTPQPENLRAIFEHFRHAWMDYNSESPDFANVFKQLQITDFLAKETDDKIYIYIRLKRPGLLIGRQGKCLDFIQEYLKDMLDKPVIIHIDEPQKFLY